jgi:pyocin large subunit-like protein
VQHHAPAPLTTTETSAAQESSNDDGAPHGAAIGFRSRERTVEHFRKHGREFGHITMDEYVRRAQVLRDAPVGGDVLEMQRGDGTTVRFDRASGAFIAFNADGVIRTFFKPNDGERYFERQRTREGTP